MTAIDSGNNAPVIVLIEDERHIRRFIHEELVREGCVVIEADTASKGLTEIATRIPALVILDLGLPDLDGLDLIRDLRGWSMVPVLVLSARSREEDKVSALDAGADDYLTKPFGVPELLARVRAMLRRSAQKSGEGKLSTVTFGEVEVDLVRRVVARKGEVVHLTPIEYRLLTLLIANADRVVTHSQLLREVWGPHQVTYTHYLRVYMARLRSKLEENPNMPKHIRTETGVGFRFVPSI